MKIRNGFVSNSSSSSFMVFGKWIDKIPDNVDKLRSKGIYVYEGEEDGPCIGVSFDIKDDETWKQYKIRVAEILTKNGITTDVSELKICYDSYYC